MRGLDSGLRRNDESLAWGSLPAFSLKAVLNLELLTMPQSHPNQTVETPETLDEDAAFQKRFDLVGHKLREASAAGFDVNESEIHVSMPLHHTVKRGCFGAMPLITGRACAYGGRQGREHGQVIAALVSLVDTAYRLTFLQNRALKPVVRQSVGSSITTPPAASYTLPLRSSGLKPSCGWVTARHEYPAAPVAWY